MKREFPFWMCSVLLSWSSYATARDPQPILFAATAFILAMTIYVAMMTCLSMVIERAAKRIINEKR
jgi:hypothetical protein